MVHIRRRGDVVTIVPLDGESAARAEEFAAAYLDIARAHVGFDRAAFNEAIRSVPVAAHDHRLATGLLKLVTDLCVFEESAPCDPEDLRRDLFSRAAAVRRAPGTHGLDRAGLIEAIARERGTTPEALERA